MSKINKKISEIPFYLTKKVSESVAKEPDAVNLSRGQAGFLPPLEIYEEAKRIINPEDKTLFKYEKIAGSKELREAIANWYKRRFNLDVNPESIVVTDGGTGGASLSFKFLTNPGDQIIIPDPAYPPYMVSAGYNLENRSVERISIGKGKLTREKLEPAIGKNTQVVMLTSPHNPTGVVYDEETLKGIIDLAKEKDFFILYDENHFPEIYDGRRHLPIHLFDEDRKHSIMLGSLSRLGIQGIRIGWAVVPKDMAEKFSATYSTQNLSINTPAQRLASFVLDNYEKLKFENYFKEYEEKRNWFIPEINKIDGFECHIPEGTSYAFPSIKKFVEKNKEKLKEFVKKELVKRKASKEDIETTLKYNSMLVHKFLLYCVKVGSVPGIAYGPESDDYIRLTFSVPKEDVEKAIEKMRDIPKYL